MLTKAQAQEVADSLLVCPFCGAKPITSIRGAKDQAMNPKAKCETGDCMGSKLPVICLDVPGHVAAWNTRATH